jgi:type IV pilus assembly protein PilQ
MNKQLLGVSGLFAASLLVSSNLPVLASAAAPAAALQVTGVRLSPTRSGVDVVLQTQGQGKPQIFSVNNKNNSLTSNVFNARLAGQPFRQDNPAPGIAYVAVTSLGQDGVQVQVVGQGSAPTGQVTRKDGNGIVLSVSSKAAPNASTPRMGQALASGRQVAQSGTPVSPLVPNPIVNTNPPTNYSAPVPPMLPRASAPPVGDMSVSQIDTAPTAIDLGTAERIPRLVLRDAPVREVLSLLARAANLNLAFAEGASAALGGAPGAPGGSGSGGPTISLDIENESVQDVFNYVLRIACVPPSGAAGAGAPGGACSSLEANRQGRTIFVGARLPDDARNTITRTIRLNQVSAAQASAFLATQGAESQRPVEKVTVEEFGANNSTAGGSSGGGSGGTSVGGVGVSTSGLKRIETSRTTTIENVRATPGEGPLPLRGLSVATDERLNTLTLTGLPRRVEIATSFLTQLDARKRQASVSVKVVDVNLLGLDRAGTSFSFNINDTSVASNGGVAVVNLGSGVPAILGGSLGSTPIGATQSGLFNVGNRWLGQLQFAIESQNAKVLTDPTLVIQEGQRSEVKLVEEVVSNFKLETQNNSGGSGSTSTITVEKAEAGLQLDVEVERIDDNGFVTMVINPRISAPSGLPRRVRAGNTENDITLLQKREVSTGRIRVRDGQTLLLTGVIQESDRSDVRKVPILGDIPLLGSLFRSTSRTKDRKEVIVMVTPKIMNDSDTATFGYGYTPGSDVQKMLNR